MPCSWLGWNHYKKDCTKQGKFRDGFQIDLTDPKNLQGGDAVDANRDGKIDPYNFDDALETAAKRLKKDKEQSKKDWYEKGGPIWRYNPLQEYVNDIKKKANEFATAKDPVVVTLSALDDRGGVFPFPSKGRITSEYSPWRCVITCGPHKGIDIAAPHNTPVMAVADGIVTRSGVSGTSKKGFGWIVVIDHGKGISTIYGHMFQQDVKVKTGDQVKKGQLIGGIGNNGGSTGYHLHFEVKENGNHVNPRKYLNKK